MDVSWSAALELLPQFALPEGYVLAQMTPDDVPTVTAQLARWYPDIQVGMESAHLQPDFYFTHCQLSDVEEPRAVLPLLIRQRDTGIVAIITYERNVLARSITCRLGVLAPDQRGALALIGPLLLEEMGKALGAELAYYFATLKTRHQQVIAERRGFQLVGIVPGHDRDMVAPGQIKRVYEALYTKLLVSKDALHTPPPEALTARTRAVWTALFTEEEED
jgi:hypothetical protein